jgi:hypothetical protein
MVPNACGIEFFVVNLVHVNKATESVNPFSPLSLLTVRNLMEY